MFDFSKQTGIAYMYKMLCLFPLLMVISIACTPKQATIETNKQKIKGLSLVAPPKPFSPENLEPITEVHANYIAILPYAFCPIDSPVVIYNSKYQWWGETKKGVIESIEMAHAKNLKVMLKPQLWLHHGEYTGTLQFDSNAKWSKWEKQYAKFILDFVVIADSLKIEMFCIGTELGNSVKQRPAFWDGLIKAVKSAYSGKLVYAANWDDYKDVTFWSKLDYIGIDAYFPLCEGKQPSISNIKEAWRPIAANLSSYSNKIKKNILFTEFGYRSADGACSKPWVQDKSAALNLKLQANAYQGFFESVWEQDWLAGIFIWKWFPFDDEVDENNKEFTPQGKPAEKIIKDQFKSSL